MSLFQSFTQKRVFVAVIYPLLLFSNITPLCHAAQFCKIDTSQGVDACLALASFRNETTRNHDVYLRFSSKFEDRRGWAAFGVGEKMAGALMFVMYPGEREEDVTISLRTAKSGHDHPELDSSLPGYRVLQKSVESGYHSTDVVCYSCNQWTGTKLDIDSPEQPWIWAAQPDQDLQTADITYPLKYHGDKGQFRLDMASSRTHTNPMSNPALLEIDRSAVLASSRFSAQHEGEVKSIKHFLFQIHGILLTIGFTVLMPLGVGIIRSGAKQAFTLHWIFQLAGTGMCLVGMAIAVLVSKTLFQFGNAHGTHKGIGLVLVISVLVQPALGYWHHVGYVRLGRRTSVSYWHIYFGRGLLVSAWLNIALGLYIAHVPFYIVLSWLISLSLGVSVMVRPSFIARCLSDEKNGRATQDYELVEDDEGDNEGFVRREESTSRIPVFLRRLFG